MNRLISLILGLALFSAAFAQSYIIGKDGERVQATEFFFNDIAIGFMSRYHRFPDSKEELCQYIKATLPLEKDNPSSPYFSQRWAGRVIARKKNRFEVTEDTCSFYYNKGKVWGVVCKYIQWEKQCYVVWSGLCKIGYYDSEGRYLWKYEQCEEYSYNVWWGKYREKYPVEILHSAIGSFGETDSLMVLFPVHMSLVRDGELRVLLTESDDYPNHLYYRTYRSKAKPEPLHDLNLISSEVYFRDLESDLRSFLEQHPDIYKIDLYTPLLSY